MEDEKQKVGDSLEEPTTPASGTPAESESLDGEGSTPVPVTESPRRPQKSGLSKVIRIIVSHLNIYFLLFVFIVILAGAVVFVGMQKSKKAAAPTTITTQPLTQEALNQVKDSDAKVGDPKQTLTIESNAIFSGQVLVRGDLEVAGGIKVGKPLTLAGLSASGTSTFDQIQANKLSLSGDANIQGSLNIQKNITSSAGATFGGPLSAPQLTVQTLQISNDLQITRHIDAGGGTPSKTDGTALGNGGTASVGGTDTAGTVTINIGGSPAVGCFVTVNFSQHFSATPHVVITPVGAAGAGLNYYVNRTSSNFSICATNAAPASQSFSFDYVAVD